MDRVASAVLVSVIITVFVGVFIVGLNGVNNSEALQAQRRSIAQNRERLEKIYDRLSKTQEQIRTNQNEEAKILKEEVFRTLYTVQSKLQQQQEDATNRHTVFHRGISDILEEQERNIKSLETVKKKLSEFETELSTQREEIGKSRNENLQRMKQLQREHKQIRNTLLDKELGSHWTCSAVPSNTSGKYEIRVDGKLDSIEVYCEQEKFDGGWMVIQHRFNGTLDFNRSWTDYRNGFGEVDGEHWLGLEHIHQFTKEYECELLIEMKDFYNNSKYARYDSFGIGSEAEQYRLTTLGKYTGTAGDSLTFHKGMKFSTVDSDNDLMEPWNCAKDYGGGWWFKACYYSSLNGLYRNDSGFSAKQIAWNYFYSDFRGLSYSRMLIRPLN